MGKKVWNEPIDKTVDWAGNESTTGLPVSGAMVQKFIKDSLDGKAGLFYYDTANNRYIVFADEMTKDEYYIALQESSQNWYEEKNDDTPFIKYILGIILAAYRDFEERVNMVGKKMSAKDMVIKAIGSKIGKFTKNDIMELCPEIGRGSVENALKALCEEGIIKKEGQGRATFYYAI